MIIDTEKVWRSEPMPERRPTDRKPNRAERRAMEAKLGRKGKAKLLAAMRADAQIAAK